ncbi:uncharacterized protein LOC112570302 [Pomacea canaliculata]|uniref:uncharacterized protein LOC112570302 n=1 Tax=Pomacea canaliculata TaxID=400727 RepID=UPI000D729B32|nr:uncharacterized protein LOC112570302 [Pomacea canaliculata]
MTFQRAVSILWPLRVGVYCNKTLARVLVTSICIFFVLVNAHILYGHTIDQIVNVTNATSTNFYIYVTDDYATFFESTFAWVDTCFASLLPFSLLLAANIVLVRRLRSSLKNTEQKLTFGSASQSHVRQKKTSSVTVTLVAVSVTFIVLTLPLSVYVTYFKTFSRGSDESVDIAAANELTLAIAFMMYFCSKTVNFYLYCLTGQKYSPRERSHFVWTHYHPEHKRDHRHTYNHDYATFFESTIHMGGRLLSIHSTFLVAVGNRLKSEGSLKQMEQTFGYAPRIQRSPKEDVFHDGDGWPKLS